MPSEQAARAQARVKPYAGDDCARVMPTPRAVATNAEECPSAMRDVVETLSSEAREPFKFTRVAADVQPKCMVKGSSKYERPVGSVTDAPAECTRERL